MTDKTGGAAFPVAYSNEDFIQEGATLRDYFAAKAMNGILTNTAIIDELPDSHIEWVATIAYEMADAMLKARG
ncbi:hypothetical protein [Providencia stuartii]|uniref:hypothetical protein n=1 Tax=Providencia stuartii TaxID=588 RepID=UPI0020BF10FD|nr:hypothetical protein [Providencia thailandensis]